jgi:phosphoribosyl-AMP cyclohydrolase
LRAAGVEPLHERHFGRFLRPAGSKAELENGNSALAAFFGRRSRYGGDRRRRRQRGAHGRAHERRSLHLTIETGIAHYWSRSRAAIWKKGETSGNMQAVKEIRVDCDQDCVLLKVETAGDGANCHTGRRSCFYRTIETTADGTPRLVFDQREPALRPAEDLWQGLDAGIGTRIFHGFDTNW